MAVVSYGIKFTEKWVIKTVFCDQEALSVLYIQNNPLDGFFAVFKVIILFVRSESDGISDYTEISVRINRSFLFFQQCL